MDCEEARRHAKELLATGEMGTWSFDALFICLRDEFRCAYCDRSLLDNRSFSGGDIFNYFSHFDHILPQSKYPALKDEVTNKTLCCVPCNRRKRDWDPNEENPRPLPGIGAPLNEEDRREFIKRIKERLAPLNQLSADLFSRQKARILKQVPRLGKGVE